MLPSLLLLPGTTPPSQPVVASRTALLLKTPFTPLPGVADGRSRLRWQPADGRPALDATEVCHDSSLAAAGSPPRCHLCCGAPPPHLPRGRPLPALRSFCCGARSPPLAAGAGRRCRPWRPKVACCSSLRCVAARRPPLLVAGTAVLVCGSVRGRTELLLVLLHSASSASWRRRQRGRCSRRYNAGPPFLSGNSRRSAAPTRSCTTHPLYFRFSRLAMCCHCRAAEKES